MGGVFHMAFVVADAEFGMVVSLVGYPGGCVYKGHGLMIIVELESFTDDVILLHPAIRATAPLPVRHA